MQSRHGQRERRRPATRGGNARSAQRQASENRHRQPPTNERRLARRLALPSRRLSQAINRTHGISVSHYVNGLRITEAQRLLRETDYPVTRVMLESGFLTKSNFNREFQRVTGTSPSAWRRDQAS